jgi:hypothetical protein
MPLSLEVEEVSFSFGGTINTGTITLSGPNTFLNGAGNINANLGTGTVTASGGTMNLREQVASGVRLAINSGTASTLNISNTATVATNIAVNRSSQTLEVATGGNLMITASENISNGTLNIQGGTVMTFGSIANNATLTGSNGNIVLTAGETLNIQASLNIPTVLNLWITNGSTLILGNAVSNNETITFTDTTGGNLQLTDFNSGGVLQGFNGKIASMTVGTSATTPTDEIDLTGVPFGSITSASINNNGTASTNGAIVDQTNDGCGGTDLFLSTAFATPTDGQHDRYVPGRRPQRRNFQRQQYD